MELLWSRNTLNKTTWIKSLATKWGNSLINQQAGKHYLRVVVVILIPKSCLILWDPGDRSLPGFSVHWIFQARILEWVAISFSRESSWPRDWTRVFCISRWIFFTTEPPGKPLEGKSSRNQSNLGGTLDSYPSTWKHTGAAIHRDTQRNLSFRSLVINYLCLALASPIFHVHNLYRRRCLAVTNRSSHLKEFVIYCQTLGKYIFYTLDNIHLLYIRWN